MTPEPMEPQPITEAAMRAAVARAGIVLPPEDLAFLATQLPMLARTIRTVAAAA